MAINLPGGMNEHYGRNVDRMPELLEAGEVPISVARFMQARLTDGKEFPDLWNHYADTSDLVVYPQGDNKDLYVLLTVDNQGEITSNGRKALELIRPGNLASNYGAIVEQLGELEGDGLIKVPRKGITTGKHLKQDQVLDELTWRVLARHPDEVPAGFAEDKDLLREYFSEVASRTNSPKNMALYVGDSLKDKTTLGAWYVYGLVDRSYADGWGDLDDDYGLFVGIAPEALNAPGKGASNVKAYTMADVQSATEQLAELGKVVRSESLGKIRSLIEKL